MLVACAPRDGTVGISTKRELGPLLEWRCRTVYSCGSLIRFASCPCRHQLLKPGIFLLEPAGPLQICDVQRSRVLTPQIDRLMLMPRFWVTYVTGVVSAPGRFIASCRSLNRLQRRLASLPDRASLPKFSQSEKRFAGRPDNIPIDHDNDMLLSLRLHLHDNGNIRLL